MKENYKIGEILESKRFGKIQIINKKREKYTLYKVRFLNTNNEKWTQKQYLDKDKIEDEIAIEQEFLSKIYTCSYGEIQVFPEFERRNITEKNPLGTKYYKVKFLKTGNFGWFSKRCIILGQICDNKNESEKIKEKVNKIYTNSQGEKFKIIEYNDSKNCKIKFLKTGYEYITKYCHIKEGSVLDKLSPHPIFKFYLGEGSYTQTNFKNVIGICHKMHHRCYNPKDPNYKNYGEKGVIVDDYFHNIQQFCDWYFKQKEKYYKNYDGELDLDKDILSNIKHLENKIYSPNTCLLIPKILNIVLAGDNLKCGVYYKKNKFKIDYGLVKYFNTFKEAKLEYAKNKKILWEIEIAKYTISEEIKKILLQYDFSWSWIWENMTEEEIINRYYK